MLIKIENIPTIKKKNPFEIKLNSEQEIKVQENWNSFIKGKNGYWDGELISVTKFDLDNNIIEIGKTKFSCLIYSKNNNDLDVRSLFVSVLFKTLDDKYVVIKNNHDKINIIGGIIEKSDIEYEAFNPEVCLKRELSEELNLDLYNSEHIKMYKMKYLKIPNPGRNYGIIYIGILNFSSYELINYYNNQKEKIDNEIVELKLLSKEEITTLNLDNDDISYLKELINFECNVKEGD